MILASEKKTRELTDKPIWITGTATSTYALHRAEASSIGRMLGTNIAAKKVYQMAGIKKPIDELDIVQVQDLITGTEIMAYEELGLCELGEGGQLVDEGIMDRNGKVASNTDGGRVACGHVGGVSGAYGACEIVRQLREEAGDRQIKIRHGKGLMQTIEGHASLRTRKKSRWRFPIRTGSPSTFTALERYHGFSERSLTIREYWQANALNAGKFGCLRGDTAPIATK
jgi:acetyl-CoA C-acetyltransferase